MATSFTVLHRLHSKAGPQEGIMLSHHVEYALDLLPDRVIAWDGEGKILWVNAAARKLFEVPSEAPCRGRDYQQFLQCYERSDEPQRASTLVPWLMSLLVEEDT